MAPKSAAEEAREHLAQAEKALKPSWLSLKFSPDHLTASLEYSQAATKFRAANLLAESVDAWAKAGEMKEQQNDVFGAGRAYESAGAICEGGGPGGPSAAVGHWQKAIRCFRLGGKGEIAAKLILKLAALREKEGDAAAAKAAFEEAIEVYQSDEKDYNLGDVYKQLIGFLVRNRLFEDAITAIDGHIQVLMRQGHFPFVHKELLAKVVLFITMKDTVRAEQAFNPSPEVQGWYMSKECEAGMDLVAAFQAMDAEAAERLLKEQVFTFLQVEVARLAKQLRVPVAVAQPAATPVVARPPADSGLGGGGAAPVAAAPTVPGPSAGDAAPAAAAPPPEEDPFDLT